MLPALRISGYDLQELIHQGTNTAIYRAVSLTNRQPAILKVLNTEYPTLEQITRLKHEYQIMAYLDCEYAVKVDRLETHPNCLVLVLEDFGGISLKKWMTRADAVESATARYQLPIAQFLNIAVQLAKALVFLHQNQIIHKDIKPANIIVNPETNQVKIADFSIASRLNKETAHLKNPDRLEGTLAYMSPEQTGRMNRAVDYRTDFYSLGVTFYELLTGKLPFHSIDPLELVHCHIAKQPIPIQQLNPQVPQILAEIAEKLMAKNAENRYQSAAGLLADLELCVNQNLSAGTISNFIPGQLEAMSQLLIPQKLYGRELQIKQLLEALERVSKGSTEIVNDGKLVLLKAFNNGLEIGADQWSGYAAANYLGVCFFGNESLQISAEIMDEFLPSLEKLDRNMLGYLFLNKQAIYRLTCAVETAENVPSFIDEQLLLKFAESSADWMSSLMVYLYKLTVANWFGEVDRALEYANTGVEFLAGAADVFLGQVFRFHRAIALAAACTNAREGDRQIYRQQLEISLAEFQHLAENCPANYQHKYLTIRAEVARLSGQKYEASECYDSAIALATENGFIQDAALVNELAARFYLSQNRLIFVKNYLNCARVCYLQWGATAKVRQLEEYYGNLFPEAVESRVAATVTASTSSHANILDLATVIKASGAIYSEIVLEKLLKKLLHIILENAGAEKGCIILERNGQMFVEVSDTNLRESVTFQESILLENSSDVPVSIVKYVARTQQPLVLSDAAKETIYQADIYIQNCQPKSILCAPILYQTKLIGIVYLENNLAVGAFTRDRLELLQLLTAQAAIALENARLYTREQHKSHQLAESLENLQQFQVELAQKEQQYRSIFETVADGLSLIELDSGKVVAVNPAICKIYGYSQEEFLHLSPPDYILPDYLHLFAEFQQTVSSRQEFNCQAVIRRKEGTLCDIEIKSNFFEYDGRAHALVISRDISDRKRAEKAVQTSEAQLRQKAEDLETILVLLQQTQAQLVQTEKISQLGQLVAGVAHEVNNPVSFISGNLHHAKDYISDLISLVQVYQETFPQPGQAVLDKIEAIELAYLVEDLPKMIDSMNVGTDRIRDIMQSLRNYSRSDGLEKKPAHIHEGIDTTLMILSHRLKANSDRPAIKIIKNYGKLPNIECYPGQLNQVFMNLIANAIDALEESNFGKTYKQIESNPNAITISTSVDNSSGKPINRTVKIRIADNGIGMSKHIKEKLFLPFFTTKAEGKGTGLGLPICHDIVTKKHRGSLECFSSPGMGTEFAIVIPTCSIPIQA